MSEVTKVKSPAKSNVGQPLTKEECSNLNAKAISLRSNIEKSYIDLSFVLRQIMDNAAYMPLGFASFKEYVESELDFQLRKAMYLVSIAKWLESLPAIAKEWAEELGWSKAKELTGRVTAENFEEWRARLEGKTKSEIQAILTPSEAETAEAEATASKSAEPSAESARKVSFSLFREQDKIVSDALQRAKQIADTDKDGVALELIATDFLASNSGATQDDYLAHVESITGLRLIAVNPKGDDGRGSIVYGSDTLDDLVGGDEAE